jgi:hypothetical protein
LKLKLSRISSTILLTSKAETGDVDANSEVAESKVRAREATLNICLKWPLSF